MGSAIQRALLIVKKIALTLIYRNTIGLDNNKKLRKIYKAIANMIAFTSNSYNNKTNPLVIDQN